MPCELPREQASDAEISEILRRFRRLAIVGISDKEDRPSYRVAAYLQEAGFQLFPVNPLLDEVLGERAYPDLLSLPAAIEIVDVFRRPEAMPEIAAQAIRIGARVLWLQEGIVHNEAAARAKEAGLAVVQNRCLLKEHLRHKG